MAALDGVTVADLTLNLPGQFAGRELLRLGARVVKIEPPDGDPMRHTAPGWYAAINDGKEILTAPGEVYTTEHEASGEKKRRVYGESD